MRKPSIRLWQNKFVEKKIPETYFQSPNLVYFVEKLVHPLGTSKAVGSISNYGAKVLQGHFFPQPVGALPGNKRALLCLLQDLGGGKCPQGLRTVTTAMETKPVERPAPEINVKQI